MSFLNLVLFELKKLTISKSTWILLAIFVSLINVSAFFLGGFLVINQASLISFVKFAPLSIILFTFLVSFITNNKASKKSNIIKLSSLPISLSKMALAKFVANNVLGLVFLLLTFSFVFTIYYLGSPDTLLVISGFIACLLLISLCFAITSFTNAISRSNLESLGFSLLIIFILCITGLGTITTILKPILSQYLIENLSMFGILNSYHNIASGFIGLNDLVLYISLIIFFLSATIIYANKHIYKIKFGKLKLLGLFAFTLIVNTSFYGSSIKFDLTSDKIYSISQSLLNIVNKLDDNGVKITFYYSNDNDNIPLEYQRLINYTNKYLSQLTKKSNGKIKYYFKNTEKNAKYELEAMQDKMLEIPLANSDSIYAGISIRKGTELYRIPYISNVRKNFLEYDIAAGLVKFTKGNKPKKIGILTDIDLGNENQTPAFIQELLKRYDMDIIPMTYPIFPKYDLVISFMTPFSEPASLYAADQYLVNGGHMLMFFDPFFRTAPEDDFLMPDRRADKSAFDHLADLLRFYGIEYDYNEILGDRTRAMTTNVPGIGTTSYPLWTVFKESEMNKNNPIFANLNNIVIPEGGFFEKFDLLPALTYTPLLTSTKYSQTVTRALFNTISDPQSVASRLKGEEKQRDVAFMVQGRFLSAFKSMPPSVKDWFLNAESIKGAAQVPEHKTTTLNQGVLVAIADMDFMADQFSTYAERNTDGTLSKKPVTDNQFFLTNTIDYLLGDYDLISLRSKGDGLRTLTKIEDLIVDDIAQRNFQESALVRDIELKINQYKALEKRLDIVKTSEQFIEVSSAIAKKQEEIIDAKRKLRFYKRAIKQNVESYMQKISLANILFAPILLLILGLIFFINRYIKSNK